MRSGIHEALELRDKDKAKWHGKSVLKAVDNVNNIIAPAIIDKEMDPVDQVSHAQALLNGFKPLGSVAFDAIINDAQMIIGPFLKHFRL